MLSIFFLSFFFTERSLSLIVKIGTRNVPRAIKTETISYTKYAPVPAVYLPLDVYLTFFPANEMIWSEDIYGRNKDWNSFSVCSILMVCLKVHCRRTQIRKRMGLFALFKICEPFTKNWNNRTFNPNWHIFFLHIL